MKFLNLALIISSLFLLFACNEEQQCEDAFIASYQRMGDSFVDFYQPKSGSFELNNLKASISSFLSQHKDVTCKYEGETLDLTDEVASFQASLPETASSTSFKSFRSVERLIPKVIYGSDDRINVSEASSFLQGLARATAAQISPDKWDSSFNIVDETLGERLSLCPGERFFEEVSVSRCSGFLVAEDIVVTAGHCVQSQSDCNNYKWVFDYKNNPSKLNAGSIYTCQSIVKQVLDNESGLDYAVVKLDRAVKDRKFLRTRSSGAIELGAGLTVIGHPSGLSTKIAGNAQVRKNSDANFFVANLDVFGGNSGSAVFTAGSSTVEGILVRGEEDYVVVDGPDGGRCRQVNQCLDSGCSGEEVVKMTVVEGIPLIADFSKIQRGLFVDQNFPSVSEGLPISFLGYSYGDYSIGGLKFLDRCGIHYYDNESAADWIEYTAGPCSDSSSLRGVVTAFGDNFYL